MNPLRSAIISALFLSARCFAAEPAASGAAPWVQPMQAVHKTFTGNPGTFAQFGDSITVTMAFWSPVAAKPANMTSGAGAAHAIVRNHMKPECWSQWKGPRFGNNGSMTIRWAHENIDRWLQGLNPEVAVILFGSNDVGAMNAGEYGEKTRAVVRRCLKNGTVPILSTAPPRDGHFEKSRLFAEVARRIAQEERVPLIDYFAEILRRRPEDWNGALPQFKSAPGDEYQVPTLIARDGVHPSNPKRWANDFSDEGLKHNGYALRNYLTLMCYAEVIQQVIRP